MTSDAKIAPAAADVEALATLDHTRVTIAARQLLAGSR